jgi:hypothetical protein
LGAWDILVVLWNDLYWLLFIKRYMIFFLFVELVQLHQDGQFIQVLLTGYSWSVWVWLWLISMAIFIVSLMGSLNSYSYCNQFRTRVCLWLDFRLTIWAFLCYSNCGVVLISSIVVCGFVINFQIEVFVSSFRYLYCWRFYIIKVVLQYWTLILVLGHPEVYIVLYQVINWGYN